MIGTQLAHYRILSTLGVGAMGDVYRARDQRLGRDVALKVLPAGLLADEASRIRLREEAHALARLSHPHIAILLDSGHAEGLDFLVMELVAGPTLAQELGRGALAEPDVVRLGAQLVRGLRAAHENGVIHRDIKPSNLGLTGDGLLKILDFGVAQLVVSERDRDAAEDAPTWSLTPRAVGSPPYMAPEALFGRGVDERTDLYAVGAVLYELATGRRLFADFKGASLMVAILNESPRRPRDLQPDLSSHLEFVILKALAKDPALRYQSARELLVDLERAASEHRDRYPGLRPGERALALSSSPTAVEAPSGPPASPSAGLVAKPWSSPWVILPAAAALVGLAVVASRRVDSPLRPAAPAPPPEILPLTTSPGLEQHPALSRDGSRLAFVARDRGSHNFDLFMKDVESPATLRLTSSASSECCLAWSPDDLTLAFMRVASREEAVILTLPALGGSERRLRPVSPWFGSALSYSPDGHSLAYSDRADPGEPWAIFVLSTDSLESRRLTSPPGVVAGDGLAAFSPDGSALAFARLSAWKDVASTDIYVVPAAGGEPRRLTRENAYVGDVQWGPDGRDVLFVSKRSGAPRLWKVRREGGEPVLALPGGDSFPLQLADTLSDVGHALRFSVAREGHRLALTKRSYDTNIWQVDAADGWAPRAAPLIASTWTDESPQFSPDGRLLAFASLRSGQPSIWTCDRSGSGCSRLTDLRAVEGTPRWSPDGRSLAFDVVEGGQADIYVADVETRARRRLTTDRGDDVVPSWSRDGGWIYFASNRTGSWQVMRAPSGGGEPLPVTHGGGFAAFESSDGKSLFYTRFDTPGLWSLPLGGGPERRVLDGPKCWGHWALGRDGVYWLESEGEDSSILRLFDPGTRRGSRLTTFPRRAPCAESALAVSPDGRSILYVGVEEADDLILVEGAL